MRAEQVASFGEQLRQARETQNITLQEIAASTKISSRALQALESEHFEQLPGGIFNKGFVRAYARYLGLDEEKMLAAYMDAAKPDESDNQLQAISSQVAAQGGRSAAGGDDSRFGPSTLVGILAVLVALGLSGLWLKEHRRESRERAAASAVTNLATNPAPLQPSMVQPSQNQPAPAPGTMQPGTAEPGPSQAPVAPATQPGATASGASATDNANPPAASTAGTAGQSGPVEISIAATQQAWISVRSDGKMVDSLLLDPDQPKLRSRNYTAKEKLRMVLGNAGGVTVVYNGKPLEPLGKPGQTMIVTFTAAGIEKH